MLNLVLGCLTGVAWLAVIVFDPPTRARRRHAQCSVRIDELEDELGIAVATPRPRIRTPQEAAARWNDLAITQHAQKYRVGLYSAAIKGDVSPVTEAFRRDAAKRAKRRYGTGR